MPPHDSPHPLAGREALVIRGPWAGRRVTVVDWYDRLIDRAWDDNDDPEHLDSALLSLVQAYSRSPIQPLREVVGVRGGHEDRAPRLLNDAEIAVPYDAATV